jgi:hypothetical protein
MDSMVWLLKILGQAIHKNLQLLPLCSIGGTCLPIQPNNDWIELQLNWNSIQFNSNNWIKIQIQLKNKQHTN